jgi:serine/threonine protein kinase
LSQGRFELVEVLGKGAFAAVCVARDRLRSRNPLVALKVLREEHLTNASAINRFRDEARILAQLDHPTIVRVEELLDYDGKPVMVMEYVRGATLEELCLGRFKGHVPTREVLEVLRQVANALEAAWARNYGPRGDPLRIIHRDVKPANIMLDIAGDVRLLDFGIAKGEFTDRRAKSLYNVSGTVGYDPPERREAGRESPAIDVYALGVTLFVAFTGKGLLLPHTERAHDDTVEEALEFLSPADAKDVEGIRQLVRDMVRFHPDQRLTMPAVAQRIEQLFGNLGGSAELLTGELARRTRRALADRTVHPAREALIYPQLRFLEERDPSPPVVARSLEEAETQVRALLRTADWEDRVPELQRALDSCKEFPAAPLVDLLRRAAPPWWHFWARWRPPAVRPTEVEATLMLLCDHRSPQVDQLARRLSLHPDQRVCAAARYLLESQASR